MAAISFTACSDDTVDYERGTWDANENYADIYFAESSSSLELDPADPLTTTLKVYRRVEHEYTYAKDSLGNDSITNDTIVTKLPKLTLKLDVVSNTDDVFEVSDAEFAEGDTMAVVTINFPKAEVGVPYVLDLQVTGADYVSLYSEAPATKLTVTRVKWNDCGFYFDENGNKVEGMCMYTDDVVTGFFGVDNLSYPVRVQERADKPGYFRLFNVYGKAYGYNEPGDWDDSKDYFIYIDATNPKKVYIPHYCEVGLVSLADYNSGGFRACNSGGLFCLVLDPTQNPYRAEIKKDFDYSLDFEGKFISEQYNTITNVQLWKGVANNTTDKCDSVFAATYGTPYCLKSPYADGYDLYFTVKDGEVKIPEGYEIQATGDKAAGADIYAKISTMSTFAEGLINLVITFQDKEGNVVYGTANEQLLNLTYTEIGTGVYTYNVEPLSQGGSSYYTGSEEATLFQCDQDPSQYYLTPWARSEEGFIFTVQADKTIKFYQSTGENYVEEGEDYGTVYFMDIEEYNPNYAEYLGKYDGNKTFEFVGSYYIPGVGGFGLIAETFVLDGEEAADGARTLHSKDLRLNKTYRAPSRFKAKKVNKTQRNGQKNWKSAIRPSMELLTK